MADGTKISWTDATWNPILGCERVSPGCDQCYAIQSATIRAGNPHPKVAAAFAGLTHRTDRLDWTGRVNLLPERLEQPLHWRKPKRIFVNSLSDLFHNEVPEEYIAEVFAVMSLAPQHLFQVLTKRHARMRSLLNSLDFRHLVAKAIDARLVDADYDPTETWASIPGFEHYQASTHGRIRGANGILKPQVNPRTGRDGVSLWSKNEPKTLPVHRLVLLAHRPDAPAGTEACHRNGDKRDNRLANLRWGTRSENQREKVRHGSRGGPQRLVPDQLQAIHSARKSGLTQQAVADQLGISRPLVSMIESGRVWSVPDLEWPLPNVHLGVSVENQKWADIRIPALVDTPAAVRWISAEPLLGPIDLGIGDPHRGHESDDINGYPHARMCLTCSTDDNNVEYFRREPSEGGLGWVVCGGESGRRHRPVDVAWIASLVEQCQQARVPIWVKQDSGPKAGKQGRIPDDVFVQQFPDLAVAA